ncbi:MAG: hypothetical protein AAGU11_05295 [Syntrophobacteraceae bacterium]
MITSFFFNPSRATEQLAAILEKHDQLKENIDEWERAKNLDLALRCVDRLPIDYYPR